MPQLLPLDELNNLKTSIELKVAAAVAEGKRPKREDIIDEMLDLFLLSYYNGVNDAEEMLRLDESQSKRVSRKMGTPARMAETIYRKVADKDFTERVDEYLAEGASESLPYDLYRIADTDSHRIYNEAANGAAEESKVQYVKTWHTMQDFRVRDTHIDLEGVTLDKDDEFYTFDGDHASAPGGFSLPENNINCRCWLEYTRI